MEKKSQQILDNLGYELVELGLDERWLSHPFFPQIIREIKKDYLKLKVDNFDNAIIEKSADILRQQGINLIIMREFNDFLTNDLYISPKHNEIWSQGFYTQSMDGSARIIYRSKSNFEFNKDGSFSTLKRSIISDNFSFLDCKDKEKSYHNCKHKTEKREYSYEGIEMKRIYYVTEKLLLFLLMLKMRAIRYYLYLM